MKYVCVLECQVRINNKIHWKLAGSIEDFDKDPGKCWRCLEDPEEYKVNFGTALEAELLEAKWKLSDAKEAVKELYGISLNIAQGSTKKEVVTAILDARYRHNDTEVTKN